MSAVPWAPVPIPKHQPRQEHLSEGMDQWLGDSWKAAKKAGEGGHTDTNVRPLLDGVGAMHPSSPRGTGWKYIATGRKFGVERRRPLTHAESVRPFEEWPKRDFVRLRRTLRPGIRFESRVRPLLYSEVIAWHKRFGAIPCCEVKKLISKARARAMYDFAMRRQQTVYFKTLVEQSTKAPTPPYSMKAAGEKLAPFHDVGAPTALATHGYAMPADLDDWRHVIDVYWGSNADRFRTKE